MEHLEYANGVQMDTAFNGKLQPAEYDLVKNTTAIMSKSYDYYTDGNLRYAQDVTNAKFDRLQTYDHAGRLKDGKTGLEARGGTVTSQGDQQTSLPYRQSYQFNAFDNLTQRNNLHWGITNWYNQNNNLNYTYTNNRITNTGFTYDADGRNLQTAAPDDPATSTYNASGRMTRSLTATVDATRNYDGDGREVKRLTSYFVETETSSSWVVQPTKYYIRSSVLGGATVSEVWANGKKNKTYVRAAGTQLAYQIAYYSDSAALAETVLFQYTDASGMSQRTTDKDATPAAYGDGGEGSPVEADPLGSNAGTSSPYFEPIAYNPDPDYPQLLLFYDDSPTYVNGQRLTCTLDGFAIGCSSALGMLGHSADIDFRNTSSWTLGQLGIFAVFNPNSGRTAPNLPNAPGDTIRVNTQQDGGRYEYYFGNVSWSPQRQTSHGPSVPADPEFSNCYTFYNLIYENPDVQEYLKDIWLHTALSAFNFERTNAKKSNSTDFWIGGELGGVVFFDQAANLIEFMSYTGYKPTRAGQTANLPDDYLQQLESFKSDRRSRGRSDRILLLVHSHPPNDDEVEARSKGASGGDYDDFTRSIYGGGPRFGVVVFGPGKFSVYSSGRDDIATLKSTCIARR